jgi:dipeptidyl aminopeptidase/acylaminoacyl peptidase
MPDADERQDALTRSVDRLQIELEHSARRNTEMQNVLQNIRADLKALRESHGPAAPDQAARRFAEGIKADSALAVSRLAEALKRHPAKLTADRGYGYQIYMLDLVEGGTTLIVNEPIPDQVGSGMPRWSHDGSRIVFDTTGSQLPVARLMAIEVRDGVPKFTDLGAGNNPTFSPDDRRIAFLLHQDAEPGAEPGIWVMQADGSGRRYIGEFGAPFWSPDGREFLINSYSIPTQSTVFNLETKEGGIVQVRGHQIFSWPSWAGPGTLVSALATNGVADSIALIDVRKPAESKMIQVLWKRGENLDVTPRWPVFRPGTRQFFFVGEESNKRALYTLERGESIQARRTEVIERQRPPHHQQLGDLSFSPDGRYLLFKAFQPDLK